jgi:hypothetical protein
LAAEVQKPKLVSRGEKPLPSGGGSSRNLSFGAIQRIRAILARAYLPLGVID